jgi:hypothetical protein
MEARQYALPVLAGTIKMLADVAELLQFLTELAPSRMGLTRRGRQRAGEGLVGQMSGREAGVRMGHHISIECLF